MNPPVRLAPPSSRNPSRVSFFPAIAFAVLCGFGSISSAPSALAYVYEQGSPSWAAGNVTFQIAMGSAGRTLADGNTSWDTAATAAFDTWNQYLGSIHLIYLINDNAPVSQNDRINVVAFASTYFGSSFGSNTLALTGFTYTNDPSKPHWMIEANTLFNKNMQWDSYRGPLRFGSNRFAIGDIRRVLIHELGHALGLNHPDDAGQHFVAVMNSMMSGTDTAVEDDINGIESIYGAPSGGGATPTPTPPPSPTPSPSPTPTPTPLPTATPSVSSVVVSAAPSIAQTGQTATYTISVASANPTAALTINYVMGGTARMGIHYNLNGTIGKVTIPPGATSANVTLTVLTPARRAKTATMFLTNGAGYGLSFPKTASVKITR
ncbi:MAG: hypothetical protein QOG67_2684 [Verrucomicrobiota bacterium]